MAEGAGSADENDLASGKRELRQQLLRRRRQVPDAERLLAGWLVAQTLEAEPRLRDARHVGLYAATAHELPTRPSFDALRRQRPALLFPRVAGLALEFAPVHAWAELEPGAHGVLAPPPARLAVTLGPEDVVIVPGVAFDAQGGRLGRGGGHYDRTFDRIDLPWLVGVAFECQLVPRVPCHSRDRRMDAIVTERGWRRVARDS